MAPCDHEEADTRLLIHLQDALQNGCTNCLVRTVDTDVVVILIGKFHHLITLCQDVSIWVAFRTCKNFAYHHINDIYEDLGREKSLAFPFFQFHGMRYYICILWKRQEVSMGGLELLSRCDMCLYLH